MPNGAGFSSASWANNRIDMRQRDIFRRDTSRRHDATPHSTLTGTSIILPVYFADSE